jgi:hypothetical protein
MKDVGKELAYIAPGATFSAFSALKNDGLPELREVLGRWLEA